MVANLPIFDRMFIRLLSSYDVAMSTLETRLGSMVGNEAKFDFDAVWNFLHVRKGPWMTIAL